MDASIRNILFFLILIIIVFKFLEDCDCTWLVYEGITAEKQCKCDYITSGGEKCWEPIHKQYYNNDLCSSAGNTGDCLCNGGSTDEKCQNPFDRKMVCDWTKCDTAIYTDYEIYGTYTYNFDLRVLNLDPKSGNIGYKWSEKDKAWTVFADQGSVILQDDSKVDLLNCLLLQTGINYISVSNDGIFEKYEVYVESKKKASLTFTTENKTKETLTIVDTSIRHGTEYDSDEPKMVKLKVIVQA
jgi:hypothetical protein